MISFLERLCSLSGHSCGPLCAWVVRRDGWWREARKNASRRHQELRARFDRGVAELPYPPVAETVAGGAAFESRERQSRSA